MNSKAMIGLLVLMVSVSACDIMASAPVPWEEGHVNISADAKGMRAFGDALNGLVTNGKAPADAKDTPHWASRRFEEKQATDRAYRPNILEGLFGKSKGAPPMQAEAEAAPSGS